MKFTIIVPSAQYLNSAGSRIRYQRLAEPLSRLGCKLSLTSIDALDADVTIAQGDIFLLSKVQDARGLSLAYQLRRRGANVGVDLFDDYFSQLDDPRFAPQRLWLREMAQTATFFLCSTARMKSVAEQYFDEPAGHILNDPFEDFRPDHLGDLLRRKCAKARDTGRVDVLWFGMGDNPNFPVGLHDLAGFACELGKLRCGGHEVRLTVLTNERALDRAGLALLRQLPVRPRVEEWTQTRERELLAENLIAFLPVNAQRFSIAKSHNRAITALTGGAQVLSAGYPLYAPLDDFIYRDARQLIEDLEQDSLRASAATIPDLGARLHAISDPHVEAAALHAFLKSVRPDAQLLGRQAESRLAILHGERSTGAIHKFARKRDFLSLGSPFCPVGGAYDAHVGVFGDGGPVLRLTEAARRSLSGDLAGQARKVTNPHHGLTSEVPLAAFSSGSGALLGSLKEDGSVAARMVVHPKIMAETMKVYEEAFGPLTFVHSELSPYLCQARELEHCTGETA